MKKYTDDLVECLHLSDEWIYVWDAPVLLKRSPSEPRKGYIDPHELAAKPYAPVHVGEDNENLPPQDILVAAMRESMGFPNMNLNQEEIITKYEIKHFHDNEVGLWRYYKRRSERERRAAFVMFHGGGWVGGSVYTVENFCKLIAERADVVVFSVDYSLAPEKPFPNGFNDCFEAVKHIYENAEQYRIDPKRIAIGGDSAGGNYAAAVALRSKLEKLPMVSMQALFYPCVVKADASEAGYEWSLSAYEISENHREMITGALKLGLPRPFGADPLDRMCMKEEKDIYNPYYSPMLAKDKIGLPKTLMITCEFDGLRQQAEFYAAQLYRAGNHVKTIRYAGLFHAAIDRLGFIPQAEDMADEVVKMMASLD